MNVVEAVLESLDEILADFPDLEADDIPAALGVRSSRRPGTRTSTDPPDVRFVVDANLSPRVADLLTATWP